MNLNDGLTANPTEAGNLNTWTAIGRIVGVDNPVITSFEGTFDGNNHTVSGIVINNESSYQGLFGYVGKNGTVKNIGVINSYIKGTDKVGGVVGFNGGPSGTVTNSYNTGNVTGTNVGGVVGFNNKGTVTNSYFLKVTNGINIGLNAVGTTTATATCGTFDSASGTLKAETGEIIDKKTNLIDALNAFVIKSYVDQTNWSLRYWDIANGGYPVHSIEALTSDNTGVVVKGSNIYDGNAKEVNVTYNGFILSKDDDYRITYSNNINAGENTATATITGINAFKNMETKSFTIAKATYNMSGVKFENKTETYSGSEYTVLTSGTLPDGVTAIYTDNKRTNAGSQEAEVAFTSTDKNYKISSMKATLTVNQKPLTVTAIEDAFITKSFDKTTSAALNKADGKYKINGFIGSESPTIKVISVEFNNKDVSASAKTLLKDKKVTVTFVLDDTNQ